MTGGDFSDPWVHALRRQQRKLMLVSGGSVGLWLVVVVGILLFSRSMRGAFTGGVVGGLIVLGAMLMLPSLVIMVVMGRRHRRLIRIVPEQAASSVPSAPWR